MIKKLLIIVCFIYSGFICAQTYIMSNTPINTCSGTYMDPGGAGNYADNSNFTQTICSTLGNCVSLTFTSFSIESGFDFLTVYDGPGTSSPQIPGSPFTGAVNPGTLTCTSGCMTIVFTSDFSITDMGWTAIILCGTCPPPPPPPDMTFAWTQKASVPAIGRHRAVSISIGNRGYTGLGHINATGDIAYDDWWEYDPGTNSWTQKANFPPGPRMHACGFTIGNFGYVGTGRDNSFTERNDLYRYDPSTNTWTAMASMPTTGRRGAVAFAVGGKGYIGTGSYGNSFWQYDPILNSWTAKAMFPGSGRSSSVAFVLGTKGYVGTGDNGGPTGDFYEYDPATNIWTAKATLAGLPRMEAAGFALMGKGYIGTGCDFQSGTNYNDFWCYDPSINAWNQVADFSGIARRYMSAFVINMRAYGVFGTSGTNYNDLWEYGNYNGIEEHFNSVNIKTFPNPFFDKIIFSIPSSTILENASLSIFDISGRLIRKIEPIKDYEVLVEKNNLSSGIYFYKMILNNNTQATGKFIAQ